MRDTCNTRSSWVELLKKAQPCILREPSKQALQQQGLSEGEHCLELSLSAGLH